LFENHVARTSRLASMVAKRRGLRIPLTANAWEALTWGIIGQQINLRFACSLRRELTELAGTCIGDGSIAHPGPDEVARLDVADLKKRRFSTSKARYLIGAARAAVSNDLPIESLNAGSAKVASETLQSIPGIGVWTANYVMMRGAGFVDCAPAGDSALSTALKNVYDLPERPDTAESGKLMEQFSPYRSFATAHLWASLKSE
jgi:3-methyladenine DNA glycosylase/8-oxoguanine DNA glycosylase